MSVASKSTLTRVLRTTVGRKFLLGLTGLALCGFLVMHLLGNLLILAGAEAFGKYGDGLRNLPGIMVLELGLAAMFVAHIGLAIAVTRENRAARPIPYAVHEAKGGRTVASDTMIWTGLLTLGFLILHLIQFRFGLTALNTGPDGHTHYNFYEKVRFVYRTHEFAWANVGTYLLAFALLGVHVRHGLQSALRSVGIGHPNVQPVVEKISIAYGLCIFLGYSSIPLWVMVRG